MKTGQPGKPANWRQIYRYFAKEYRWGPDQVNELTQYQMNMYMATDEDVESTIEPTVPQDCFPLQWKAYLSRCASMIERFKATILRAIGE